MPVELLDDSVWIRRQTTIPFVLNESVTTFRQVRKILYCDAAAVLLPNTYQCGGLWACKIIGEMATSSGVPCVLHRTHDLRPKTATMLHLVASKPNYPLANDGAYYGLEDDVITESFQIEKGMLNVPKGPGLGIEFDKAKVRKYEVSS